MSSKNPTLAENTAIELAGNIARRYQGTSSFEFESFDRYNGKICIILRGSSGSQKNYRLKALWNMKTQEFELLIAEHYAEVSQPYFEYNGFGKFSTFAKCPSFFAVSQCLLWGMTPASEANLDQVPEYVVRWMV